MKVWERDSEERRWCLEIFQRGQYVRDPGEGKIWFSQAHANIPGPHKYDWNEVREAEARECRGSFCFEPGIIILLLKLKKLNNNQKSCLPCEELINVIIHSKDQKDYSNLCLPFHCTSIALLLNSSVLVC